MLNLEPYPGADVVGVVIEGLEEDDLALLDLQETSHLPRQRGYVASEGEQAVPAQISCRGRGNHEGKPAERYRAIFLLRARDAGPALFENVALGTVDAFGQALRLS